MELLDKLQACRTVGPSFAASFKLLAHCQNVACLSLFIGYYSDRWSSELAQLVSLPYSWRRTTCYSNRSHYFSVTIPKCYKDVLFFAQLDPGILYLCFTFLCSSCNSIPCSGCSAFHWVNSNFKKRAMTTIRAMDIGNNSESTYIIQRKTQQKISKNNCISENHTTNSK